MGYYKKNGVECLFIFLYPILFIPYPCSTHFIALFFQYFLTKIGGNVDYSSEKAVKTSSPSQFFLTLDSACQQKYLLFLGMMFDNYYFNNNVIKICI